MAEYSTWLNTGVSYGEALARSIWEYLRLSDYFRVKYRSIRYGQSKFDDAGNYWKAVIEQTYMPGKRRHTEPLNANDAVKLVNFNIIEWFPWLPGRYWTRWGDALRHISRRYIMHLRPKSLERYGPMLLPRGKTLTVLSGVGSVRMREHGVGRTRFKIVGATTRDDASSAIPVVMSDKAYGRIQRLIDNHGSVNATIEGIYAELPASLDDLFYTSWGVPRSCIYVGSKYLIKNAQQGGDIDVAAWTIYDRKQPDEINLAYCYFSVQDRKGPARAGEFLAEYIRHFQGTPLTDFDEKVQRLDATIPITKVATGAIDLMKLNKFIQRIRRLYREPPT